MTVNHPAYGAAWRQRMGTAEAKVIYKQRAATAVAGDEEHQVAADQFGRREHLVETGKQVWGRRWEPLYDSLGTNPFAAMPSLHFGWALWCAWVVVTLSRRTFVRVLGHYVRFKASLFVRLPL